MPNEVNSDTTPGARSVSLSAIMTQALVEVWPRLPERLGRRWAEIYPRVEELLERLCASREAGEQRRATRELMDLVIGGDDRVRAWLGEVVGEVEDWERTRAGDGPAEPGDPWDAVRRGVGERLRPTATRHTDVSAPLRVGPHARVPVTVALTRQAVAESVAGRPLTVALGDPVQVHLWCLDPGVEVLGDRVQEVEPREGEDSEPLVFFLRGTTEGPKDLVLSFRQAGQPLGEAEWRMQVVAGEERWEHASLSPTLPPLAYAPPPNLELRVKLVPEPAGGTRLRYLFHSPDASLPFHFTEVAGPRLEEGAPQAYQRSLLASLRDLSEQRGLAGRTLGRGGVTRELEVIGRDLWTRLFGADLKRHYEQIPEDSRVLLVTDDPWIPWELVKPYDDTDPDAVLDHDHLCVRFQLTRWLAGPGGPQGSICVRRAACVDTNPGEGAEGAARRPRERDYLLGLAAEGGGLEVESPEPPDRGEVEALLDRGGIDLWHFACHGDVRPGKSEEAGLMLAGGELLLPPDVDGRRQTHVKRNRPLIFLNACRMALQGRALVGLGGWAVRLVDVCRCGALVAPHWEVRSSLAHRFAVRFYDELRKGRSVGEAAAQARALIREEAPDDPTWLAYVIYANPNTRVRWAPCTAMTPGERS